jgi:hypothetical protein
MKRGMFSESLDPVAGNCWRGGADWPGPPEVAMSKPRGKPQRNGSSVAVTTMRDADRIVSNVRAFVQRQPKAQPVPKPSHNGERLVIKPKFNE